MNILDQKILLELFREHYLFFTSSIFFLALILTWYFIPKVLWVSREKFLVTEINHRSSHKEPVPSFGGIPFFLVLVLLISLLQGLRTNYTGNHLIIGLTFLFMAGLKDDLVTSTAQLKLITQVFAAGFIIFSPELKLTSLHGFLGIYNVPLITGYSLKLLIVVALINAYNFIDGIDGLAAILGMVISLSYSIYFYLTGHLYYVLISIIVTGILLGFLRFNFSSGIKKILMGNGGSLTIGFIISFLSLKILSVNPNDQIVYNGYISENTVLFAIAVLFLPIFDTLRVIFIRLRNQKSPFHADRNHIHHVLLDNGLSHKLSSIALGGLNILVILIYVISSTRFHSLGMSIIIISLFLATAILFEFLKNRPGTRLNSKTKFSRYKKVN